jgi:RES domain-containing protein
MASRAKAATAPLRAYRIADSRFPIFSGQGSAPYGVRWNSPGNAVIYAAETYAGALLECLAHTGIGSIPRHQAWIEITIPAGVTVETVDPSALRGWDDESLTISQAHGDEWFRSKRSCLLVVPSVVSRVENNVLIHTGHPQFRKIKCSAQKPVQWDERLFVRRRSK